MRSRREIADAIRDALGQWELFGKLDIALLIGSATQDYEAASDWDVLAVSGAGYSRQFHTKYLRGKLLEIEVLGIEAARSYHDSYFWYPQYLAAEIGKFRNSILIHEGAEFDAVSLYTELRQASDAMRAFIATFHLGCLSKAHRSSSGDPREYYGAHMQWSLASVLCAIDDNFPSSVTRSAVLACLSPRAHDIANRLLSEPSLVAWADIEELAVWIREESPSVMDVCRAGQGVLYFPQNAWGLELLGLQPEQWDGWKEFGVR